MVRSVFAIGLSAVVLVQGNSKLKKVMELLGKMVSENTKTMQEEQVLWAERSQWCTDTIQKMGGEIKEDVQAKKNYESAQAKAFSDVEEIGQHLAELQTSIQGWTANQQSSTATRKEEHKEHLAVKQDYEESVSALERAVIIIERSYSANKKIGQGDALLLLQKSSDFQSNAASDLVINLLSVSQPSGEAAAYESKSNVVLELLEKTEAEFKNKLHEEVTSELNRKHNYESEMQRLTDLIEGANQATDDQSINLSTRKSDGAKAKENLEVTVDELNADRKDHRQTSQTCDEESKSYKEKQQLRTDEIAAQNKAIEILQSAPQAFLQSQTVPTSFLQTHSFLQKEMPTMDTDSAKVSMFLRHQSSLVGGTVLSLLADRIAEDPFVKVKSMIREMLDKLKKEALGDQTNHQFCVENFSLNKKKKQKYTAQFEKFSASQSENIAKEAQLKEQVGELRAEVTDLNNAVKVATKQRNEEKAINEKSIAEAKDGQDAISHAIEVLEAFYEQASKATAFLQIQKKAEIMNPDPKDPWVMPLKEDPGHTEAMATFGDTYTGNQDKAAGVLGLMQVVLSDLAREESEVKMSEAAASDAHGKFVQQTKVALAKKSTAIDLKSRDADTANSEAADAKSSLSGVKKQMKAADEEYNALRPQCPASAGGTKGEVTFEQKQKQRQEEIDSLKMALDMLKQ